MKLHVMKVMNTPPGPRHRNQGEGSGEAFRDDHLIPAFDEAVEKKETLYVCMDGAKYGYPTSFLEEAFGGLARARDIDTVKKTIRIECTSEPMLYKEVRHYIKYSRHDRTPPYKRPGGKV